MSKIQVISQDNKLWDIKPSNLKIALDRGATLANAGDRVKVTSADGKEWDIKTENLKEALNRGAILADPGITDYAKAGAAGAGHGLGKVADTAIAAGNLINTGIGKAGAYIADKVGASDTADSLRSFASESADYAKDYWENDKIAQDMTFDTGLEHDKGIRMAKNAGEFVGTLPLNAGVAGAVGKTLYGAGKALQIQKLQKAGQFVQIPLNGSTAARFAGAGAGAEALRNDDPNTGSGEQILRELGGIVLGDIAASGAMAAPKAIWEGSKRGVKAISNLLSPERWYEWAVKRGDTTLDTEAIEATKAIGGKLDAKTIYKDNNVVNFIEKNFPAKAYQVAAKNTNDKIIASIEKQLDNTLGKMPQGVDSESTIRSLTSDADNIIDKFYRSNQEKNNLLYDKAFATIKETDPLPSPQNSIKAAQEVYKKTYAPSTAGTTETGQGTTSTTVGKILKEWSAKENVPYEEMIAELRALKEQRRLAGRGYKKLFDSVEKGIEEDIKTANPQFFELYNTASKDYASNIAPFAQLDAARALIQGDAPNFIWEHMNTPTNRVAIKDALELAGDQGKKLYDVIRRAKAQSVIMEQVQHDGTFKPDKFIELFTKLKPEDEIVDLIGKDAYRKIKGNAVILARKMKDVEAQLSKVGDTATGALLNKYGTAGIATVGGAAGYTVGGIRGAVIGAGLGALTKDMLAKAFAKAAENPVLMNRLIKAAETNNDKLFISTLNKALERIKSLPTKATESIKTNPALKTKGTTIVIDGSTVGYKLPPEENKKRPKGQALKQILNSPAVKGYDKLIGLPREDYND